MQRPTGMAVWIAAVLVLGLTAPASAETMDAGNAITKLGRGAVNLATGWVEIPKRIQETSVESGTAAGWTWGLLRGLGYGFIRTVAGAYEIVTFPFPAPPHYEPVIQPEYVFTDESVDSSYRR
ncbi:MAG: exosortase system-associated protein, TIGR04073 family [Candidatus Omnitrophica bacterium]|nr:exosortase system-associated protein, TIGR04073 family [Candidatus Omnitrophota bacterium]